MCKCCGFNDVHVFNFLVRLLLKCSFYSRAASKQWFESPKAVKAVIWHDVTYTVKRSLTSWNLLACKSGSILPYTDHIGSPFLSCGFCATWVWRKCGVWSSATLYTTLRYVFHQTQSGQQITFKLPVSVSFGENFTAKEELQTLSKEYNGEKKNCLLTWPGDVKSC